MVAAVGGCSAAGKEVGNDGVVAIAGICVLIVVVVVVSQLRSHLFRKLLALSDKNTFVTACWQILYSVVVGYQDLHHPINVDCW